MSWFFASDGQSIGISASASFLPVNIQDLFPLGWTDWISLQSKGLSRVFSNTSHSSIHTHTSVVGFSCGSAGKESACNAGDLGSIPGLEDPLEKGKATHSSNHTHFVSLGNFISRYLILFTAMVNGIDSLISLSGFSVSI